MKRKAKFRAQSDLEEKKKGVKAPVHPPKTATSYQANPTSNGFRELLPTSMTMLQRTVGNRAVADMIAQRDGAEDELNYPGPRGGRQAEDELDYPGPRLAPERANGGQRAGGGAIGNVGDAVDLDGRGLYGWDRVIRATDVATVVNGVILGKLLPQAQKPKAKKSGNFMKGILSSISKKISKPTKIVILSGTHGNAKGHLVNDAASRGFVNEDQATANKANALPGVEVKVVDVVTSYTKKSDLLAAYKMPGYIRILGWCYSGRSHGLGKTIKSNWWKAPNKL